MPELVVVIVVLAIFGSCWASAGAAIGVCFGREAENLPPAVTVAQLIASSPVVAKVRLFTYDTDVLLALAETGLDVVIGIDNAQIPELGQSKAAAADWVDSLLGVSAGTHIVAVAVGSEVITSASPTVAASLVPAMANIHAALTQLGLDRSIKVSTPHSMAVLGTSFPPSAAAFEPAHLWVLQPLLDFLSRTGSYLMANVYPYYAYTQQRQYVPLDYALLRPNRGVTDVKTGLHYWNMFDAQVDALYYAMAALQHPELGVVVTETGWPSMGRLDELDVVNLGNAASYNGNLVRHLLTSGTPLKPGLTVDAYIFELFNEDLKPGATSFQNWGLLKPDGSSVYELGSLGLGGGNRLDDRGSSSSSSSQFCVADPGASLTALQAALDWACGPGHADCDAIQPGQPCYQPDSLQAHASYAFNSYYQSSGAKDAAACSFSGAAVLTRVDPSRGACLYKGRAWPGQARARSSNGCWTVAMALLLLAGMVPR